MTFVDEFETYLLTQCHLALLTVAAYKSDVQHFCDTEGVSIPTKDTVVSFLTELNESEYAKRSIARKTSSLTMYCQFLASEHGKDTPNIDQLFESNLALNLPKLVSTDSMNQCLNFMFDASKTPLRNRCMIGCLYYVGLRVSEVVALELKRIYDDYIIVVGKGGKERIVPISNQFRLRLDAYLRQERQLDSPWLFYNARGAQLTRQTITIMISNMCRDLGIVERVTPHTFRHMFATHLLNKGMDIREVQLILGHSSINTTQIYTHLDKSKLRHVFQAHHPLS